MLMKKPDLTTPTTSDVYYKGIYWNDYKQVIEMINEKISGHKNTNWMRYFKEKYAQKKFQRALFLNCGNGWVERELYENGVFVEGTGIDYSDNLLEIASIEAEKINMPVSYISMDINSAILPEGQFDLIVNHAACHHIAYINKVMHMLSKLITDDGKFVNFDYVGPHRNQYSFSQWLAVWKLNKKLPSSIQKNLILDYPHLPTMIATDPSEAIHSELILETTRRYFDFLEHKQLGGGLAYPLLTHNKKFWSAAKNVKEKWIPYILDKDRNYTMKSGVSLFDFFVCERKQDSRQVTTDIAKHQHNENLREANSKDNNGFYYNLTLFQLLISELQKIQSQVQLYKSKNQNGA
jgi:ubiquinone/menaquinone biosynthesis C-methylase UbiE